MWCLSVVNHPIPERLYRQQPFCLASAHGQPSHPRTGGHEFTTGITDAKAYDFTLGEIVETYGGWLRLSLSDDRGRSGGGIARPGCRPSAHL